MFPGAMETVNLALIADYVLLVSKNDIQIMPGRQAPNSELVHRAGRLRVRAVIAWGPSIQYMMWGLSFTN